MSCAPCCSRLPFRLATGLRTFTLPPTSSTFCPPRPSQPLPPTSLFLTPLPPTPTYGSSGAPATRTPLPLLPISSPLAPVGVSFLGTPLSTRGTGVSISSRIACWSPGTSSSTSHPSPLPPLAHLLTTWTPSSRPVMRFARLLHSTPLLLQVLWSMTPRHARLWHPSSPQGPSPHHATRGPSAPAHASPTPPPTPRAALAPQSAPRVALASRFIEPPPPGVSATTFDPRVGALSRRVVGLPPCRCGS
jgi:hypothetical protein